MAPAVALGSLVPRSACLSLSSAAFSCFLSQSSSSSSMSLSSALSFSDLSSCYSRRLSINSFEAAASVCSGAFPSVSVTPVLPSSASYNNDVRDIADLRYFEWIASSSSSSSSSLSSSSSAAAASIPTLGAFRSATAEICSERSAQGAVAFLARIDGSVVPAGTAELSPIEFEGAIMMTKTTTKTMFGDSAATDDDNAAAAAAAAAATAVADKTEGKAKAVQGAKMELPPLYVTDVVTSRLYRRMGVGAALMSAMDSYASLFRRRCHNSRHIDSKEPEPCHSFPFSTIKTTTPPPKWTRTKNKNTIATSNVSSSGSGNERKETKLTMTTTTTPLTRRLFLHVHPSNKAAMSFYTSSRIGYAAVDKYTAAAELVRPSKMTTATTLTTTPTETKCIVFDHTLGIDLDALAYNAGAVGQALLCKTLVWNVNEGDVGIKEGKEEEEKVVEHLMTKEGRLDLDVEHVGDGNSNGSSSRRGRGEWIGGWGSGIRNDEGRLGRTLGGCYD